MLSGFWQQLSARPDFWGFVSIPLVAAVATWVHVWMALKLMFYPIDFIGLRTALPRRLGIDYPGIGCAASSDGSIATCASRLRPSSTAWSARSSSRCTSWSTCAA